VHALIHGQTAQVGTAILIIMEGQFQLFQRFSGNKLVPRTVESRFEALYYYENRENCSQRELFSENWYQEPLKAVLKPSITMRTVLRELSVLVFSCVMKPSQCNTYRLTATCKIIDGGSTAFNGFFYQITSGKPLKTG
jgi:hypothetical protein